MSYFFLFFYKKFPKVKPKFYCIALFYLFGYQMECEQHKCFTGKLMTNTSTRIVFGNSTLGMYPIERKNC